MTFTAKELENALRQDGNTISGETIDPEWPDEIFWESNVGDLVDVLGIGVFEVVETVTGKKGEIIETNSGGNTWRNWVILKHTESDRHFRLPGEFDSWDAQGWDYTVQEVKNVPVIHNEWQEFYG